MDNQTIVRRALLLARCGIGLAALATFMATWAAYDGRWWLWGANVVLFLIAATCTVVNYATARRHAR